MGNTENENNNKFGINDDFILHSENDYGLGISPIEKNYTENLNNSNIIDKQESIFQINNSFSKDETKDTKQIKKRKKNVKNLDNIVRKMKTIAFNLILKYYNKRIKEIKNNNLGKGVNYKVLLKINQEQIQKLSVNYNKSLLKRTMKDIFSADISRKYKDYPLSHNKYIIKMLLNEEDEKKRNELNKLFNKTFLDCLKQLRGDEKIDGLEGLEQSYNEFINNEIKKLNFNENNIKYINEIEKIFNNFDKTFLNKKHRK